MGEGVTANLHTPFNQLGQLTVGILWLAEGEGDLAPFVQQDKEGGSQRPILRVSLMHLQQNAHR